MAVNNPTSNYGLVLPTVGGDTDAWGGILNTLVADDATGLDKIIHDVSVVASAALPKAGGTMSGVAHMKAETLAVNALGSVTGATALDMSVANVHTLTVGGAITLSVTNPEATGLLSAMILKITNGGSAAVTFPASFKTPSAGGMPTLTISGVDVLALITFDGGTSWLLVGTTKDVR